MNPNRGSPEPGPVPTRTDHELRKSETASQRGMKLARLSPAEKAAQVAAWQAEDQAREVADVFEAQLRKALEQGRAQFAAAMAGALGGEDQL